MRLILSRKGFDSTAGGVASPILPDGTMFSLPIPSKHSPIKYEEITLGGHALGRVVPDLTTRKLKATSLAHLDPDLAPAALPGRKPGWRGLFGQGGGAQTTLAREGVGPGDVFLFFGWFRHAEHEDVGRAYRFVKGSESMHVLWGWLQVDEVIDVAHVEPSAIPPWATYHPHITNSAHISNNTLYAATEKLTIGDVDLGVPGGGVFPRYDDRLRLTKPGASRSSWTMPAWFHPGPGRPPLGSHGDPARWTPAGNRVELQTVARGQEFVLDLAHYPEASSWIRELVSLGR